MHPLGKICPVHGFHPVNAGRAVAAGPGVLSCAGRAAEPGREHGSQRWAARIGHGPAALASVPAAPTHGAAGDRAYCRYC
jgi:hypothetical protein